MPCVDFHTNDLASLCEVGSDEVEISLVDGGIDRGLRRKRSVQTS